MIDECDWDVIHLRRRAPVRKIKCGWIEGTTPGIWRAVERRGRGNRRWDIPVMVEMSEKAGVANKAKEK
jgi:hypothetical protein